MAVHRARSRKGPQGRAVDGGADGRVRPGRGPRHAEQIARTSVRIGTLFHAYLLGEWSAPAGTRIRFIARGEERVWEPAGGGHRWTRESFPTGVQARSGRLILRLARPQN